MVVHSSGGPLFSPGVRTLLRKTLAVLDGKDVKRTGFGDMRSDVPLETCRFRQVKTGPHQVLMHCSGEMILPVGPQPNRIDPWTGVRILSDRVLQERVVRFGVAADYGYLNMPRNLLGRYPDLSRAFLDANGGDRLEPFRAAILGIKAIVAKRDCHFMVNCGDLLYPSGALHPKDRRLIEMLRAHDFVDTYLIPGNHEYGDARTAGDPYAVLEAAKDFDRIVMPALYYSQRVVFDGGSAKLIFLNSSTLLYDLEQQKFLRDQLREGKEEWRLVFLHHAPFSDGEHGDLPYYQQVLDQGGALEGPHRAHFVFSGHEHSLQVLNHRPDTVFPKFVVCGYRDPVHGDAYACKRRSAGWAVRAGIHWPRARSIGHSGRYAKPSVPSKNSRMRPERRLTRTAFFGRWKRGHWGALIARGARRFGERLR